MEHLVVALIVLSAALWLGVRAVRAFRPKVPEPGSEGSSCQGGCSSCCAQTRNQALLAGPRSRAKAPPAAARAPSRPAPLALRSCLLPGDRR